MGFSQLYYTSCERGLSGHPGYQFNAATPGVRADVMAEVEALTAYDPPRSLAYDSDAAEIARAPVNLCYRPGSSTVLAQVAFVGTDYSRRSGNYFAHALVTENAAADFDALLPIELWGSPLWTREQVDDPELPVLTRPVRGGLDRGSVADFVASHPGARHLAALVTAIDLAMRQQDRKVVVIERDAEAVARWIAAASYLLPPNTARQMSFATYEHEPRYSRMHVVGTLAESEVDRSAFDTYHLFDFVADEISPVAVHPLAELLVHMGVDSAEVLWQQAYGLAAGAERGLHDWYPVVLADNGADREGTIAVAPWLAAHARRLGAATVDRIGALLDVGGCPADTLARLAEAANGVGARNFAEYVEFAWVTAFLEADQSVSSVLRLCSSSAREHASAALAGRLPSVPADTAVTLLDWALHSEIRVSSDVQYQAGLRSIGPAVLDRHTGDWLARVLSTWPALRAGIVAHVATSVHGGLAKVVALLSSDLAPSLGLREVPELSTAVLVADVRAGLVKPPSGLARIAGFGVITEEVLTELWPDGGWTHHEALLLLNNVEKSLFCEPPLLGWLDSALLLPGSDGETYDLLCAKVREEPVMDVLPSTTVKRINVRLETAALVDRVVRARTAEDFDARAKEFVQTYHSTRNEQRRSDLVSMLLERTGELRPEWFALLYLRSGALREAYLDDAEPFLRPSESDPVIAANLLTLAWHLKDLRSVKGARAVHQELLERTLESVRKWRRAMIRQTLEVLRRRGLGELEAWFSEESRGYAGNPVARFVLKRMRVKGPGR